MNVSCVSRQCSPDSGSSSSVSSGPGSAMTRPAVWRDDNGCRAVFHQEAGPVRLSEQQHVHPAVPAAEPDQQQHQHRAGLLQLAGPVPDHPREVRPNPWWSRHWWHSDIVSCNKVQLFWSGPVQTLVLFRLPWISVLSSAHPVMFQSVQNFSVFEVWRKYQRRHTILTPVPLNPPDGDRKILDCQTGREICLELKWNSLQNETEAFCMNVMKVDF